MDSWLDIIATSEMQNMSRTVSMVWAGRSRECGIRCVGYACNDRVTVCAAPIVTM